MRSHPLRPAAALAALLLAPPAVAEPGAHTLAITAAGGWDYPTQLPVAGLQLVVRHDGQRGFAFVGALDGLWAFLDDRPLVHLEAGFMGVVPSRERATIRVGLVGGASVFTAPYALPFQVGGVPAADAYGNPGFLPNGALLAELGWRREAERGPAAWALGLRFGAALSSTSAACSEVQLDCSTPQVVFDGGVYGRLKLHEGLFVELLAGPSPRLGLGYAPRLGPRRAAAEEAGSDEPAP